ncbi:MAG: hypothetical protein JG782_1766, partial [Anaerophaga sp.]|nr:hypothetical protein [Anaerophaga sp.]
MAAPFVVSITEFALINTNLVASLMRQSIRVID